MVVNSGSGEEAKLDLRVWRFEFFARPTARADGNERLINCPGGTLRVDVRVSEGRDPLVLVWLESEIDRDRNKSDSDENDANQIAQWETADEPQRQKDRNPNDDFAKIGLHQNEQAGRSRNRSREQQPQHRMHLAKLSQEYRQNHYPGDNRKLRRLKIDRPQMQPTARPVNLGADKLCQ